ncbi:MAG: hypothetical protein EBX52_04795, partial [Proteobacteria bacterium]|nr:hypothetical protein [Pseudomonadota bacterium]
MKASLKDPTRTFRASYGLDISNFTFREAAAARIHAEGGIDLADRILKVKTLEVDEVAGADEAGILRAGPVEIPLSLNRPFAAGVKFERAGIHWLGGIVAPAVAPLEARISGKADLQFVPDAKSWMLKNNLDLVVADFALTNQKWGEKRPMKYILRPPLPLRLKGGLEAGPKGIEFKDLSLSLNQSRFKVAGGIHADTGFDFTAKGPVDLKEVREIAGNLIRGEGNLEARIHGTADELLLDFDPQIVHASYLGLDFGNLKGRITYDDGISELRFTDIKANHKNTFYSLKEGYIDLSGSDEVHLPIQIHSGRIEDLREILHSLVAKISWFPSSLRGEVHGPVDIGGRIDLPGMVISSQLEGSDWIWLGERARRVRMSIGYDKGLYYARDVSLLKSNGALKGEVEFNSANDEMDWDLSTDGLSLNDFDFFERLELPARSRLQIQSSGSGKMGQIQSSTQIRGFGTEVKGEHYRDSKFILATGDNRMSADVELFGGDLQGQLRYSLIPKQPSSFRMDLNRFDFSPTLLILNPKLVDDPSLVGRISGHVQLDFLSTQ